MSVMPGVARGEAGGRKTRCLCVQRGFFLPPRTSRRLSTPRRSHCATETCPCAGWVSIPSWEQRVRSARVGRGGAGAVRVPGGLVRAVCSAWRSSLRGRRGSRGRCGKRVVRGGTRERRRGPASTFLFATCFRAVGNELQAAVQCECRAVGGAASPWLDAGRVHWRLQGGVQSRHTQRDARMGRASGRRACLSGGWVCGAGWAMRQL